MEMEEEIWDGYDENGELLGVDLIRGKAIPDGVFHIVASVLVKHTNGDYLIMQRDMNKTWSGFYEATAGGAVLKGETPEEGAIREVKEETGLSIKNPILLKRTINHKRRLIIYQYLATTTSFQTSVKLQPGETMAYKWLNEADFRTFCTSNDCIPGQGEAIMAFLFKQQSLGGKPS